MARILVIDDDDTIRRTLRQHLEADGHSVAEAEDGAAAERHIAQAQPPELVITDIFMPNVEGIELILRLRHDFPHMPCLAISGGGRTRNLEFLDLARKAGARATLTKPIRPADLRQAVAACLKPSPRGPTAAGEAGG